MKALATLVLAAVLLSGPADMTVPQQDRAARIYKEIRCPVCVAQSVAESDAQLSSDIRARIDSLVVAGKTDEQIRDELSRVYGDDIRLKPRAERRTWLLWVAPWVFVVAGGALALRRRR